MLAKDNWFEKNKTGIIIGAVIGLLIYIVVATGYGSGSFVLAFAKLMLLLIPLFVSRIIPINPMPAIMFMAIVILTYSIIGLIISMIINSMRKRK